MGGDAVQGALDVAGLAPGVGILADLANAGISVARGNYRDAALSMAAAIPIVGTAAGVGKLAHKAAKTLDLKGGKDLFRVVDDAELADIKKIGAFRPGPNSIEGRQFVDNLRDAQKLQKRFSEFFEGRQTVV